MIQVDSLLEAESYFYPYDVVIFDLDDTLYAEKTYVKSGFHAVSKLFPNSKNIFFELFEAFENGQPAFDVVFKKYNCLNLKSKAIEIYRTHIPKIELYPAAKDILQRLEREKKVGIITDGRPEGQRAKLKALRLENIYTIITDELGGPQFRKPCDTAFKVAQKHFNLPYNRMVYVGDNIEKDFIAPCSLGMQAIWFRNTDGIYYK